MHYHVEIAQLNTDGSKSFSSNVDSAGLPVTRRTEYNAEYRDQTTARNLVDAKAIVRVALERFWGITEPVRFHRATWGTYWTADTDGLRVSVDKCNRDCPSHTPAFYPAWTYVLRSQDAELWTVPDVDWLTIAQFVQDATDAIEPVSIRQQPEPDYGDFAGDYGDTRPDGDRPVYPECLECGQSTGHRAAPYCNVCLDAMVAVETLPEGLSPTEPDRAATVAEHWIAAVQFADNPPSVQPEPVDYPCWDCGAPTDSHWMYCPPCARAASERENDRAIDPPAFDRPAPRFVTR